MSTTLELTPTYTTPKCVVMKTSGLIERLIWSMEPSQLTAHDVNQIVSAVVTALGETDLTRFYTELNYIREHLNLVDYDVRFPNMEAGHLLTAAIVEFAVDFMELLKRHRLYHTQGPVDLDPFPYIFVRLLGWDTVFRRVNG